MSLVRLENVSKRFDGEPVLTGVNLRVEEKDKIGLVGRNGSGKSTIFRLITGELEADGGTVERMRRARFAHLAQIHRVDEGTTLMEVVMGRFTELIAREEELRELEERLGGGDEALLARYATLQDAFHLQGGYEFRARIRRVLSGLGFHEDEFSLTISALSGGQRTRLMLALVLLEDADLLLLDEPENHLDVEAREWLESFLKDWNRAFVIISHDRQMLNEVVTQVVEVERGEVRSYSGNYKYYVEQKALLREQQQRAYEKQREFIQREESWISRFRYKNTKARQVQSRIKRLEKLELVDAPLSESATANFGLGEVVRSGAFVLRANDLSMAYGDLQLYRNVSFEVTRGERVGIIGPNGAGKTTLLRQLANRLPEAAGEVILGHKVVLGFYEQHHESLNVASTILDELQAIRPDLDQEQLRSFMGRFLFTGEDVFKPVAALSGGEISRVAIAKLVLGDANVLLLDEPTNHLDIASREALEAALATFEGTLVIVSHDRALIDRLVDKLVIIENGGARVHLGNYSHYRWKRREEAAPVKPVTDDVMRVRREKRTRQKVDQRARDNERRRVRRELEDLEASITEIEGLAEELERKSAALDPGDFESARAVKQEYDALKADLKEMYAEWEALAEQLAE